MSEGDIRQESQGESRREFLKKAGKVAWVVPTLQVVNMSAALAGGDGTGGSVVVTTPPTTEAPRCECRLTEGPREYFNGDVQIGIGVHVSENCVEAAKYINAYVDGEFLNSASFAPMGYLTVPEDWLPLTLRLDILDANQNLLASCSIDLDSNGVAVERAANAGGRARFHT